MISPIQLWYKIIQKKIKIKRFPLKYKKILRFQELKHYSLCTLPLTSKRRAIDNVFIERLWRSVKYENIYLNAYETGQKLYHGLDKYFRFYNGRRHHQTLQYHTQEEVYKGSYMPLKAA